MKTESIRKLVEFFKRHADAEPITSQIELYQAMADCMPTVRERIAAQEIATTLAEVERLQLDFSQELFAGLKTRQKGAGR